MKYGHLPSGVRRVEQRAAPDIPGLKETLAAHDAGDIARATQAMANLYQDLRLPYVRQGSLMPRAEAEAVALEYLEMIRRAIPNSDR
jgi:hypothetical protein